MRARSRAPWWGLAGAITLITLAAVLPALLGWDVASRAPRSAVPREAPPLHGWWDPRWWGPGTLPAIALAVVGARLGPATARRLSWGPLLLASYLVGLAWLLSLALVDGTAGVSRGLGGPYEYLPSARQVGDVPAFLSGYVDRIPMGSAHAWPTELAGHPPGIVLFFVCLVRIGLGGSFAAGLVVTAMAATTALAVLVALRALGAEAAARTAAPFLVLTPAAVFMAVSADAVFAATGAWGLACLALATRADTRAGTRRPLLAWSAVAGLLLGACVMMSYGLPLLGVLAVAVLIAGGSWRPLPVAAAAALLVVLGFAAAGFAWWEAFPVLRERYWDGIAGDRPMSYWGWGSIAALLVSAGPLLGAGLAHTAARWRGTDRTVLLLVAAAASTIAIAVTSRMSKAEVERIWLPFLPWLTLSVVVLPDRWRRWGLVLQVVWALLVQHLLYTTW